MTSSSSDLAAQGARPPAVAKFSLWPLPELAGRASPDAAAAEPADESAEEAAEDPAEESTESADAENAEESAEPADEETAEDSSHG